MHEQFLLAALEQATHGQGSCAPNPSVGAVAVQDGKIIAQAWHEGAGTPHAEQLLLTKFPANTPGVTLYSTLEPCNHWGRTPPCVDVIIQHGIQEVVFSYLDPNPIVANNNSSEKLRQHGIKVTHRPLPAIDEFYKSYRHWVLNHKPRVTVKMAQSLDGKIAGPQGQRIQLSNDLCAEFTHKERAKTDVILTTAQTIRQDNPQLNVRLNGKQQSKPVAILDTPRSLTMDYAVFSTASRGLIYHGQGGEPEDHDKHSVYPMPLKDGKMDLAAVLTHLGGLGFHDLWVEAGATLFSTLHLQGLVHRTYLYIVPKLLGNNALAAYQHSALFDRAHTVTWQEMGDNLIACLDWQERT